MGRVRFDGTDLCLRYALSLLYMIGYHAVLDGSCEARWNRFMSSLYIIVAAYHLLSRCMKWVGRSMEYILSLLCFIIAACDWSWWTCVVVALISMLCHVTIHDYYYGFCVAICVCSHGYCFVIYNRTSAGRIFDLLVRNTFP